MSRFRTAFYGCLSARADAFFELTDALLCADGPTRTPVELSLLAEHQRGYGSLYGALNHGRQITGCTGSTSPSRGRCSIRRSLYSRAVA
ncbi:transposase [Streptomyces sp. 2A115]|uniref:transposase n=1 Tax=Streptomyces sp. 2A115 TaxID=3457439 RepID=UPI003FD28841